jgi:DNA-binding IclR family transcriptional regulator
MTLTPTAPKCADTKPDLALHVQAECDTTRELPVQPAGAGRSRGVLDGAFAILEALAHAHGGLGLTDLTRASGLAKTSAYRLSEQLVALGAVQRVGHRYYIGARLGHLGQRWQPNPVLRQAAHAPVHELAMHSRAIAALRILHDDTMRMICTTVPCGRAYLPTPIDRGSTAQTATGRVLYAADRSTGIAQLPECWSPQEWRRLRGCIGDLHTVVIDHQEVFAGICCASAPVWWPNGNCAGAVTALVQANRCPPGLAERVSRTARRIDAALEYLTEPAPAGAGRSCGY